MTLPADAGSGVDAGTRAVAGPRMVSAARHPPPAHGIPELTRGLARGDEGCWRAFHAAYAPRLFRYLIVVTRGDETRAADALQSTFVRAARHIRPFDSEEVLWSWLTALARSAAVDEHRRTSRFLGFLRRFTREWTPAARGTAPATGTDTTADAELAAMLEAGLAELTQPERRLLARKYLDGAAVRDLAVELDTTEKAVESRLTRARGRLRAIVLKKLDRST